MKLKVQIYHVLAVTFLVLIYILGFSFLYPLTLRTYQVIKELGYSIAYYGQEIFYCDWGIKALVNESNFIEGFSISLLPLDADVFGHSLGLLFWQFFCKDFFLNFFYRMGDFLNNLCRVILLLVPVYIFIVLIIYYYFKNHDQHIGKVSKSLQAFDKINDLYLVVKYYVSDFIHFFIANKYYFWFGILALCYFTNIFNIAIAALSYYFYICCSLDFISLVIQVIKLFIDLSYMFKKWLIPVWFLLLCVIIHLCNKNIANKRLQRLYARNCMFVDSLGLLTMITGVMAKGKTTVMTDFMLTQEDLFKNKAYDEMIKFSVMFPSIDFRLYEVQIDEAMSNHEIYNLSSAKSWVRKKLCDANGELFGYDEYYFDGVKEVNLFDVMYNYCLLYWVYTSYTSLLVSNYAVRSALHIYSKEHLIEWSNDLLSPSIDSYYDSNYSHILDFNTFRSLKKINNKIEWANSLDVGVYGIDEIGKERLNAPEMEDIKKAGSDVNQKNDGFNLSLKMARHRSTINNYPYFKLFSAEQRDQSVNSDLRELNDCILEIQKDSDEKIVYPSFLFIGWFMGGIINFLTSIYKRYRHSRDDVTLMYQIVKNLLSWFVIRYDRFKNKYGIRVMQFHLLNGSGDPIGETKYYLIYRKIYSNRFSTDAFSDFYEKQQANSSYGLNDVETYNSHRASLNELDKQNSYFINNLLHKKNEEKVPSTSTRKSKYKWKEF